MVVWVDVVMVFGEEFFLVLWDVGGFYVVFLEVSGFVDDLDDVGRVFFEIKEGGIVFCFFVVEYGDFVLGKVI